MRYKFIAIILTCLVLSNCRYQAVCYDEGEIVYSHEWDTDPNICPEYFGEGWWKIPGKDKPEQIECHCSRK